MIMLRHNFIGAFKIFPLVSTLIPRPIYHDFCPYITNQSLGPKIDFLIISMINNTLKIALNKWPILPHVHRFLL